MKRIYLNLAGFMTSIMIVPNIVKADLGHGGMAECFAQAVQVALQSYAQTNGLTTIPNVVVSKSNGSPSNGLDLMVTVNSQKTYYIIANPSSRLNSSGTPIGLLGCTGARIP